MGPGPPENLRPLCWIFFTPLRRRSSSSGRPSTISGFRAQVYDFQVQSENSHWRLYVGSQTVTAAYAGSVWVDPNTARVLRIEMQARNIPSDFPMDTVESAVDYSYVMVGEKSFLLPVHAESLGCQRGTSYCSHNIIDFRNYHEFKGDIKIIPLISRVAHISRLFENVGYQFEQLRFPPPAQEELMSPTDGNAEGRTVTLHMVSSLDGFIAKSDNSVSWLDNPESVYEAGVSISEEEVAAFVKSVDCYVLGSRTYEHALELGWPYGDTPTVVITNRALSSTRKSVEFYSGDLKKLVDEVLAPRYRNIWLVGGAMLCQRFLELGLVDEIKLTIAPVLLGGGLRLFDGSLAEERWNLKNVVAYKNGFVELSYSAPSA